MDNPTARTKHISRRAMLGRSAAIAAGVVGAGALGAGDAHIAAGASGTKTVAGAGAASSPTHGLGAAGANLKPVAPLPAILAALDRYPLVAVCERHLLQEMHDFYGALLRHPALPGKITDVVVEFGNALHQDLADRFILGNEPVSRSDLARLWRFTIGGGVYWDAPVYEQLFRTVRAVNWMLPPRQRIRVLLGDPPFDHSKVRGAADKGYVLSMQQQRDAHYAAVVENEVLRKGRRALLIAGSNHLLRGITDQSTPPQPNAATRLAQRHPGALYVVDLLVLPPGAQTNPLTQRAAANVAHWPRPALAALAGTWLGATTQSAEPWINSAVYLAGTTAARRYGAQADAVLYLGPSERLTASQADPAIYQCGAYRAELQRLSHVATQIEGQPVDLVAEGLRRSQAGPSWFLQFGPGAK